MARLWLRVIKNHKIIEQRADSCAWGDQKDVLNEMCKQLDLPCPIWLNKHVTEYETFRRTAFIAEHFMEDIVFDRMEIEFLDDTGVKRKSNDPRNQF